MQGLGDNSRLILDGSAKLLHFSSSKFSIIDSYINMKALVGDFNPEKALVSLVIEKSLLTFVSSSSPEYQD